MLRKQYKSVDISYLENNSGGNALFIIELIQTYLKNEQKYLGELHQIIEERNQEKFDFHCHKMESNYATFGAKPMIELIQKFKNTNISSADASTLEEMYLQAKALHKDIRIELSGILNNLCQTHD